MDTKAEKIMEAMHRGLKESIAMQNIQANTGVDLSAEILTEVNNFMLLRDRFYKHIGSLPNKIRHAYRLKMYDFWLFTRGEDGDRISIMLKDITAEAILNRNWN